LPAQRAERITDIDGDNGNRQKDGIGAAQRVQKFFATKIAETKEPARPIRDKPQDTEAHNSDQKLPRRSTHELASLLVAATHVKAGILRTDTCKPLRKEK
jgi:hypothetical protein